MAVKGLLIPQLYNFVSGLFNGKAANYYTIQFAYNATNQCGSVMAYQECPFSVDGENMSVI